MNSKVLASRELVKHDLEHAARIVVTAEIGYIRGNSAPHFSITGSIYERGRLQSCGCIHDDIRKYFPELAPLIKWHLSSTNEPMHYLANSMFWMFDEGNLENFKSASVWGTVESDDEYEDKLAVWPLADKESMAKYLADRLPTLMARFDSDMNEFFKVGNKYIEVLEFADKLKK